MDKDLTGLKTLVVDDNEINLFVVEKFLKKAGIDVYKAQSGDEALDALNAQKFDIILMDLNMPVMDGYETAEKIRNSQSINKETPIIALTAHSAFEAKELIKGTHLDDFITKPFELEDMVDKLYLFVQK